MTMGYTFFFFLAMALAATSFTSSARFQNHLLMPGSPSAHLKTKGINCLSWRLAVETNNLIDWIVVPEACAEYVAEYMTGHQYLDDGNTVVDSAIVYANSLDVSKDGKDIWIFDIGETALSNLPYYARPDVAFGAKKYNSTKFGEWLNKAEAPALPPVLDLYHKLVGLGIKIVFLSSTYESYTEVRAKNLIDAGYIKWEKLILKPKELIGTSGVIYKSKERAKLEAEGYRIVGNIGDSWRDLIGTHVAKRSFKYPNPMYYVD